MSKNEVKIVKNFRAPKKIGTHYRLLSLTGVSKGISYYLEGNRAVIGRSEKADISILDPQASREHAEIVRFKNSFIVTDLKSQNGVIVNDLKIVQHTLVPGDKIVIGSTVFKYDQIDVDRKELDLALNLDSSNSNQQKENSDEAGEEKGKGKRKNMILLLGLIFGFLLLSEDEEGNKAKKVERKKIKDVSSNYENILKKKKEKEDAEEKSKIEGIIHRGQREFREKNYFRALEEFNQALIMDPGNGRASFYKRKTKQALDNTIEEYFTSARREVDSLRVESALINYCAIMRLLEGYEDDERYKQSERQLRVLELKLGMLEGDYKCISE